MGLIYNKIIPSMKMKKILILCLAVLLPFVFATSAFATETKKEPKVVLFLLLKLLIKTI